MKESRNSFHLNGHTLEKRVLSSDFEYDQSINVFIFQALFSFRCRISAKIDRIAAYSKARKLKRQNCYYKLLTVSRIYHSFLLYRELSRSQFRFRCV